MPCDDQSVCCERGRSPPCSSDSYDRPYYDDTAHRRRHWRVPTTCRVPCWSDTDARGGYSCTLSHTQHHSRYLLITHVTRVSFCSQRWSGEMAYTTILPIHCSCKKGFHSLRRISTQYDTNAQKQQKVQQVAQLSQRDRAAGWVSNGQKWKTGTERQYLRTI